MKKENREQAILGIDEGLNMVESQELNRCESVRAECVRQRNLVAIKIDIILSFSFSLSVHSMHCIICSVFYVLHSMH